MQFDSGKYGEAVEKILALDGNGERLMPLAGGTCSSAAAKAALQKPGLFIGARADKAALSGLWLYFSCLDESHSLSQDTRTENGSFWHAIMHRQEPDAGNSSYWFRRMGSHPVFASLAAEAGALAVEFPKAGFKADEKWDPFSFIDFCERARRSPGSDAEQLALRIQRVEWQLLFDYCASPGA